MILLVSCDIFRMNQLAHLISIINIRQFGCQLLYFIPFESTCIVLPHVYIYMLMTLNGILMFILQCCVCDVLSAAPYLSQILWNRINRLKKYSKYAKHVIG